MPRCLSTKVASGLFASAGQKQAVVQKHHFLLMGRADEVQSAEHPAAAASAASERQTALLEEALRQARRANLPLLVSRLPSGGGGGNDHARCLVADAALLDALQAHVRFCNELPPAAVQEHHMFKTIRKRNTVLLVEEEHYTLAGHMRPTIACTRSLPSRLQSCAHMRR